jgi:hypothetical protein
VEPDEWNHTAPVTGLAAADGQIFVPAGNTVVSF